MEGIDLFFKFWVKAEERKEEISILRSVRGKLIAIKIRKIDQLRLSIIQRDIVKQGMNANNQFTIQPPLYVSQVYI